MSEVDEEISRLRWSLYGSRGLPRQHSPAYVESDNLRERLVIESFRLGSRKALAEKLGVTGSMLSAVISGRKAIPDNFARYFGLTRKVVFVNSVEPVVEKS